MTTEVGNEPQSDEAEAVAQLYAYVVGELEAGKDRDWVAGQLVDHGLARDDAERMTNSIFDEIEAIIDRERYTRISILRGALGGLFTALVSATVWTGLTTMTGFNIGILAWGIGALCGYAVVQFSGGRRGVPLQIAAVATGALGIILGKCLMLHYSQSAVQIANTAAASTLTPETLLKLLGQIPGTLTLFDGLWIILALVTAWKLPMASGLIVNTYRNPADPLS